MIRIGHARSSNVENTKQVEISTYYNNNWTLVLRPKTRRLAIRSANFCEAACNNNYIRYSQSKRNTLKTEALAKAGLADKSENLAKLTLEHVKNIKTECYVDCASFMTFCAMAAGAKISYGYTVGTYENANTVSTIKTNFTIYEQYTAIATSKFVNEDDYLLRGDILVSNGHVAMVLDDGGKLTANSWPYEDSYLDITTTKLILSIVDIDSYTITASVKVSKIDNNEETDIKEIEVLNTYKWYYKIKLLSGTNEQSFHNEQDLIITSAYNKFSINDLVPNCYYMLNVGAKEKDGEIELLSSNIIFKTPQAYPTAITNLKVNFNELKADHAYFNISFNSPSYWGNTTLQKYYRLFLFVNGECVAFNDDILNTSTSYSTTTKILLDQTANLFTYNDTIQIGIQPGMKDANGIFIFLPSELRCSEPIYIKNYLELINKTYIKVQQEFKQAVVHITNKESI